MLEILRTCTPTWAKTYFINKFWIYCAFEQQKSIHLIGKHGKSFDWNVMKTSRRCENLTGEVWLSFRFWHLSSANVGIIILFKFLDIWVLLTWFFTISKIFTVKMLNYFGRSFNIYIYVTKHIFLWNFYKIWNIIFSSGNYLLLSL